VDLAGFEHKRPAYLRPNAIGVVPTLLTDHSTLIESHVIARFLDWTFPGPSLIP
jgi:glutathione S-transferase